MLFECNYFMPSALAKHHKSVPAQASSELENIEILFCRELTFYQISCERQSLYLSCTRSPQFASFNARLGCVILYTRLQKKTILKQMGRTSQIESFCWNLISQHHVLSIQLDIAETRRNQNPFFVGHGIIHDKIN